MELSDVLLALKPRAAADAVTGVLRRVKPASDELADWLKERAAAEDAYAKQLTRLARRRPNADTASPLGAAWDRLLTTVDGLAAERAAFARDVLAAQGSALRAAAEAAGSEARSWDAELQRLARDVDDKDAKLAKRDGKARKMTTDKDDTKLAEAQKALDAAESAWIAEAPRIIESVQLAEETRLISIKSSLSTCVEAECRMHHASESLFSSLVPVINELDIAAEVRHSAQTKVVVEQKWQARLGKLVPGLGRRDSNNSASPSQSKDAAPIPDSLSSSINKTTDNQPQNVDSEGFSIPQGEGASSVWQATAQPLGEGVGDADELPDSPSKLKISIKPEAIVDEGAETSIAALRGTLPRATNSGRPRSERGSSTGSPQRDGISPPVGDVAQDAFPQPVHDPFLAIVSSTNIGDPTDAGAAAPVPVQATALFTGLVQDQPGEFQIDESAWAVSAPTSPAGVAGIAQKAAPVEISVAETITYFMRGGEVEKYAVAGDVFFEDADSSSVVPFSIKTDDTVFVPQQVVPNAFAVADWDAAALKGSVERASLGQEPALRYHFEASLSPEDDGDRARVESRAPIFATAAWRREQDYADLLVAWSVNDECEFAHAVSQLSVCVAFDNDAAIARVQSKPEGTFAGGVFLWTVPVRGAAPADSEKLLARFWLKEPGADCKPKDVVVIRFDPGRLAGGVVGVQVAGGNATHSVTCRLLVA